MRGRLKGTALVAAAFVLVAVTTVAVASSHNDVYYACLSPGGELSGVTVNEEPVCKGNKTLIQWNETGPGGADGLDGAVGVQGPPGPAGADGHLSCDDERRVNAAAPSFEIREECGLIVVSSGFDANDQFSMSGSNFAESPPFGNPPGYHDVAYRFEVESADDVVLEYIEVSVTANPGGGPLQVYLVPGRPAFMASLSSEPDMDNVLEQWEVTEAELITNGIRFSSVSGPTLEANARYWVVLTTPEESTRYQWWVGLEVVTGAAKAERYGFQVGDKPPGTWIGTDGAFAPGLKVVGVTP